MSDFIWAVICHFCSRFCALVDQLLLSLLNSVDAVLHVIKCIKCVILSVCYY